MVSLHLTSLMYYMFCTNFLVIQNFFIFLIFLASWIASQIWPNFVRLNSFCLFIFLVINLVGVLTKTYFFAHIYFEVDFVEYQLFSTQIFSNSLVILVVVVTFFSWIYLSERFLFKNRLLFLFLSVFLFCTINMVYTDNLLSMFIFFEFIFFPSLYFAYTLSYSKKAEKTIEYLLTWTLTGALIAFCGLAYLSYITGTTSLYLINTYNFSNTEQIILLLLFFFGFGIKIPVWPFYYWLTKVHVEAPTGFSMFLSGFLVKTAFFCFSQLLGFLYSEIFFNILVSIIIFGICDASSRMWSIIDLKRLIALATVQEMNMILLFLFLLANTNFTILNIFLLVHGFLSVFFFFLVDVVYKANQTRSLLVLSGVSYISFSLTLFVWIAILVYRGFPLFAKFYIEWELLTTLIKNFSSFGFVIFLFFAMISVASFFKHWTSVLYGSPDTMSKTNVFLYKDQLLGVVCVFMFCVCQFFFFFFKCIFFFYYAILCIFVAVI